MKTRLLILIAALVLHPFPVLASQTRILATGGLSTLVDDETSDLNLFLNGNPAGLIYLNTKDRFDLAGQWAYSEQTGPWGSGKRTLLTTLPDPSENSLSYGGLMIFPDPHWAIQASGQVLSQQGLPTDLSGTGTQTLSRYLGMVRGAYAFSFASLGLEFSGLQDDKAYDAGLYDATSEVLSGSSVQGRTFLKLGAAATFPEHYTVDETRLRAGIHWATPLGTGAATRTLTMDYLAPPSFTVSQVLTPRASTSQGAEVVVEMPGVMKAGLSAELEDGWLDLSQAANSPPNFLTFDPFPLYQFETFTLDGQFRWTLSATETENLKLGGGFSYLSSAQSSIYILQQRDDQQLSTRFGLGLEAPRDYVMGFQWQGVFGLKGGGVLDPPPGFGIPGDIQDRYQFTFGGEKWVAGTWALRLGLTGEIDHPTSTSIHVLTTTINAGAGVEEAFGRADLRLWLGQGADMANSANAFGLVGFQVSGTLFL